MTEYDNRHESEIVGYGIHEDEITIELSDNHEYKYYLFTQKIIGEKKFKEMCHAARNGNGLLVLFNEVKDNNSDKW